MMKNFEIPSLNELYSQRYDESMNEWRRLGSLDKANNIKRMLDSPGIEFSPSTVLEVGAGTGDVLKSLYKLISANQFVGVEISPAENRIDVGGV